MFFDWGGGGGGGLQDTELNFQHKTNFGGPKIRGAPPEIRRATAPAPEPPPPPFLRHCNLYNNTRPLTMSVMKMLVT